MDSFNNNFKSFDDQDANLPEGFGWDDMEEGIYAKMPTKKKRRVAAWWWFGVGFFMIGISTFLLTNKSDSAGTVPSALEAEALSVTTASDHTALNTDAEKDDTLYPVEKDLVLSESINLENTTIELNDNSIIGRSLSPSNFSAIPTDRLRSISTNQVRSINSQITDSAKINRLETPHLLKKASFELQASHTVAEVELKSKRESENNIILAKQLVPLKLNELQPLTVENNSSMPELPIVIAHQLSAETPKASFLTAESLTTIPTSISSPRNSVYSSPWYGLGGSVGYQKQFAKHFGVSARYTFQQVAEEFSFTKRDTVPGGNLVDHTVNYVDLNTMSLLATTTSSGEQQFDRFRNVLSYNRLNVHQFNLYAHYNRPIGALGSLEISLGGGIQYLSGARGLRLDSQGELVDLAEDLSTFKRMSGTLDASARYMHRLTPKLDLTAGLNFSQTLPQGLSLRINSELPSVISGRIGLRWRL